MEEHESLVECHGLTGPFYPVPEWLARTDLPFGAKMFFAYLLFCVLTKRDVPPISEIAEQIGMTKAAAVRNLQLLREAGFVQTERTRTAPVRLIYRLYQPASSLRPLQASESAADRCIQYTADGLESMPSNGSENTPSFLIYREEREKDRNTPPPVPPQGGSGCDSVWRELLSVYPKRGGGLGHTEGRKVLERLLKAKTDPEAILEGARRYAAYIRATKREGTEYVAMIPTWLRQRRWEEDWTPPRDPKAEEEEAKRRHAEELREFLGLRKLED
jgi:predicted transcriptional regulator